MQLPNKKETFKKQAVSSGADDPLDRSSGSMKKASSGSDFRADPLIIQLLNRCHTNLSPVLGFAAFSL
jgi:hypothetical protein